MKRFTVALLLLGCLNQFSFAQRGYSSASVSMNMSNRITSPDQIVIEEYLNYHTHRIPLPKAGHKINIEPRWASTSFVNNEALLQIGISTTTVTDFNELPPVNISLVIDRSGSMASEGRLEKVKVALRAFIKGLRKGDIISIVTYDHKAEVILASQTVSQVEMNAIDFLQPGGSTNLHGGMMLGYQEVEKHINKGYLNRVLLLTDGIANVGVTDPEELTAIAARYASKGVELNTIGVGGDVNYTLLRQLAALGEGQNHFVGDAERDVKKAFEDELEALLSSVAQDVHLSLDLPNGVRVSEVMGAAPKYASSKVMFDLDNMNAGLTQVILIKLQLDPQHNEEASLSFNVTMNYENQEQKESLTVTTELPSHSTNQVDFFEDVEVKKNYTIGYLASALKSIVALRYEGKSALAKDKSTETLNMLGVYYPTLMDNDIIRIREMIEKYKEELAINESFHPY